MQKPHVTYYCKECDEFDYEYVCHVCGADMTEPLTERGRDRFDDDGLFYGHPGDFLRGLE